MKQSLRNSILGSIVLLIGLISCDEHEKKKELPFKSVEDYEQTMILSHKEFLKAEKEKIQNYKVSSELQFKTTGTGLNYSIYKSAEGDSIKKGEIAIITYLLRSIEGDTLYESPKGKFQEFMVDYDDVESGLHEGIKNMKVGEKAIMILPAHLAHGITGDQAAISYQTTLVYDISLVSKR